MPRTDPRRKNTGSVFQRKSDGKWVAQLDVGFTPSGNRRRLTASCRTRKQAETKVAEMVREVNRYGAPEASATMTVKRWADQWLGRRVKEVRPKTYSNDASAVRRHIIPTIGKKRLAQLKPSDVRDVDASARKGNGGSTALRAHTVLITMLKAAREDGHQIPESVFNVKRPKKSVSDRDAIPVEAALQLLQVATTRPDAARWVAALLQGMRPAECLGLTWDAVDFDKGLIDVSWQLQPLPYLVKGDRTSGFRVPDDYEARRLTGAYHLVRPKTEKGKRIVPLVPWMAAALQQWREIAPSNAYNLVWATDNGRPMPDKTDRERWRALLADANVRHDAAGRDYDLYEARHTAATLLLEAGVDPEVVKTIMGHSNILVTRGYQHVNHELKLAALGAVAERLKLTAPAAAASSPRGVPAGPGT